MEGYQIANAIISMGKNTQILVEILNKNIADC